LFPQLLRDGQTLVGAVGVLPGRILPIPAQRSNISLCSFFIPSSVSRRGNRVHSARHLQNFQKRRRKSLALPSVGKFSFFDGRDVGLKNGRGANPESF
jgi:hypothetical protein